MRIPPSNVSQTQPIQQPTGVNAATKADGAAPNVAPDSGPSNQPVNRWRGQLDVPVPPMDPLPPWLAHPFKKHGIIMEPDRLVPWKAKDVFNPAAIVKDGQVHLFPRCEDESGVGAWHGTSRVGHYVSDDGLNFRPASDPDVPILEPTESFEKPGGCEDPRVVQLDNGTFVMTYTAFDGNNARLALAVSSDLVAWEKQGLVFDDAALLANPAFVASTGGSPWTKAGAVVPEKIGDHYVMYFGEGQVFMATSKDGIHWDFDAEAKPVMATRPGFFDQGLVEAGPPPWVDAEGIHLLYHGDAPPLGYQLGEVVFDKTDPGRILRRSASTLLKPDQPYEVKGQVGAVIFAEGLAKLNDTWFLYYGAADGKIAVASAPAPRGMSPIEANIAQIRRDS